MLSSSKEKEISEESERLMGFGDNNNNKNIEEMEEGSDRCDGSDRVKSASLESYKISFEGVGLVLKTGVKIMNGVTGEFLPMRTCAIMGPSGAGKVSTIGCRQFLLSSSL
jgi:ABC-type multidrug transport system fused ATPase/permease subunit